MQGGLSLNFGIWGLLLECPWVMGRRDSVCQVAGLTAVGVLEVDRDDVIEANGWQRLCRPQIIACWQRHTHLSKSTEALADAVDMCHADQAVSDGETLYLHLQIVVLCTQPCFASAALAEGLNASCSQWRPKPALQTRALADIIYIICALSTQQIRTHKHKGECIC